jgi:hypothetical protein
MEKYQRYDVLKDLLIAEDRVFGDRMNIFLVVNSIMLVAFGQFNLALRRFAYPVGPQLLAE